MPNRLGPRGQYDVILESDDTTGPTTVVGLVLARDQDGKPRWTERRVPPVPPQLMMGPVQYASKDPRSDLIYSQVDWSKGALQAQTGEQTSQKYAQSTGLDMRGDGVVTLGMQRSSVKQLGFIIRNPGFEGGTTSWTAGSGVTFTAPAGAARSGSLGGRLVTDGSRTQDQVILSQAITNPTIYRSRTIQVIVYLRRTVGSVSGVNLDVTDGVGIAVSSNVTSSTFTYVTASLAVDAGATALTVRIKITTAETGSAQTFEIDDFAVIPTGGVVCNGLAERSDVLYGIFGRCICQWDETNDVWDAVYIDSANACTDIIEYDGNLYVSFSGDNAYVYGATTSWTASNIAGDAKYAYFWAVSQGTLWKSRKDGGNSAHNFVNSSTNPVNGGAWGTEATIGSLDREITRLYAFDDTIVAGKEDGLHVFNRVVNDWSAAATWQNVTQEWEVFVDPDNFSRGQDWHGALYMMASQQSLFYLGQSRTLVDISSILTSPRLSNFGGRVRAFSADPVQLWLLVDTPTADTTATKTTRLMSLRLVQGQFVVHTMEQVTIGDINELSANRGYLWAIGRIYNTDASAYEPAIYRWTLPVKTVYPAYDATPAMNITGNFDTPRLDWGMPDENKAFIAVTIITEPNVLNQTGRSCVVAFGMDGASSTGTTLATFTGSGAVQIAYFDTLTTPETQAVGKSIQLNVTLNTQAATDTTNPKLYGVVLHALLRPARLLMWELMAKINVLTNTGASPGTLKSTVLTNLGTLENQVYPIELTEDFDEDGTETTHRVIIVPGTLTRVPEEERDQGVEVYSLVLQKVTLA